MLVGLLIVGGRSSPVILVSGPPFKLDQQREGKFPEGDLQILDLQILKDVGKVVYGDEAPISKKIYHASA